MIKIKFLVVFTLLMGCFSCNNKSLSETTQYLNYKLDLSKLLDSLSVQQNGLSILIEKNNYKLSLIAGDIVIKEYPVVFGKNPVDDKRIEGDKRTPEGKFKIRDLYPHKSWSKFLWIDYPTEDSWKKYNKAKSNNQIPADAEIGGEIGIHGVPKGKSHLVEERVNWTWGCISLTNVDINELYPYAYKGMEVKIVK